jgi:uncharacterized membrane protein YiaA
LAAKESSTPSSASKYTMMETGYFFAGLVLIAVVALIIYLIRRNRKDEKQFEKDFNRSELKPDKHDDEHL